MSARAILDAYRWQRELGHRVVNTPYARLVTDPTHPEIWDANHASTVTAEKPEEADAVLQAMDDHLAHTRWRVVHTDPCTPEPFAARLALDGFEERPATIQMRLEGQILAPPAATLRPVEDAADWALLAALVRRNHEEAGAGQRALPPEVTDGLLASYRAKQGSYRFCLGYVGAEPVAYGAAAAAPSGAGMIEDLFTSPACRRRGIASGIIATLADELRAADCTCIFLGASVGERSRLLYAKLGFRPLMLTRCWVRLAP